VEFKDYYQTLGVARDAPGRRHQEGVPQLARKYHPDVSKEPDAGKRMAEVNEANTVLSDPQKRAAYDQLGRHAPGRSSARRRAGTRAWSSAGGAADPTRRSSASSSRRSSAAWGAKACTDGTAAPTARPPIPATTTMRASCSS
jgi:DnaJ-class molecular chaperone